MVAPVRIVTILVIYKLPAQRVRPASVVTHLEFVPDFTILDHTLHETEREDDIFRQEIATMAISS